MEFLRKCINFGHITQKEVETIKNDVVSHYFLQIYAIMAKINAEMQFSHPAQPLLRPAASSASLFLYLLLILTVTRSSFAFPSS
ncbi:hypothetical protein NDS46_12020 [Paenibacillus thiaminolyticus]|uniref:hypothetical protein n=1 Tax=Paenibacillus thiaminolyticus TaxID=49283 RepID=UPI00232B97D6|nr:hypothetical protein [Paenibacillus thiaminolyticus]WCF10519.1 hypothetical protein NDS46_12020 [Paenibacillus thiaminolyticus]